MCARSIVVAGVAIEERVGQSSTGAGNDSLRLRRSLQLDGAVLTGLTLLAVTAKAAVLDTPYYWDEELWIGLAHKLAQRELWNVLPGLHPQFLFGNRPPGLFLPMAAIFKLTGPSIWLSHAFILCFAIVGVFFTYRLTSLWFGRVAGVFAALFLFLNATYFTQSAMFLADLPVAAVAVTAVYFGVQRRFAIYWPCALYLLTLKEPAMAVVSAFAAWAFMIRVRTSFREAVADALRYAAPLVLIALYYVWQWLATGYPFVHYLYHFEPASTDLAAARRKLPWVNHWLLVEQGRWIFSLLIVAGLAVRSFRRRRELLLLALLFLAGGYSYAFIYFLPRYLLPIAPFFFAVSAGALVALLRDTRLQIAAGVLLVGVLVAQLDDQPRYGTREWSMGYLPIVRIHKQACALLEREFQAASVWTEFPFSALLSQPELGYVSAPRKVFAYEPGSLAEPPAADLILVGKPGDTEDLESYARSRNLQRIEHFAAGNAYVTIYAARAAVARAP